MTDERLRPTSFLTVGELAARAGIATSAVRFYEKQGLLISVRTAGNQRRYPRYTLRRLSIVLAARRFGIPLEEVADLFETLPNDRMPSQRDWARIARLWHTRLEARRHEIEQLESELTGCLGCGCLSLSTCTVLNPGDALGAGGTGPLRLGWGDGPGD